MRDCITVRRYRIAGARVHIHWSVLTVAGFGLGLFIRDPIYALIAVASYFSIILMHEAGHALVAKRLGYQASHIHLGLIHGTCEYDSPEYVAEEATIAWGGVLVQLSIALPLIALGQITSLASNAYFSLLLLILGYANLYVALFNLIPVPGLDGAVAWRLLPIIFQELRSKAAARKAVKDVIRRIK